MLKSQDMLMLLELALGGGERTVRAFAADLGLDPASIHRSLKRLGEAKLWNQAQGILMRDNACEVLVHGVRYFFPASLGGPSQGIPTAWSAAPLAGRIADSGEHVVWPDPLGAVRGHSLQPLHPSVPALADRRPDLCELLVLVDGIRVGDARVRGVAAEELTRRVMHQGRGA